MDRYLLRIAQGVAIVMAIMVAVLLLDEKNTRLRRR